MLIVWNGIYSGYAVMNSGRINQFITGATAVPAAGNPEIVLGLSPYIGTVRAISGYTNTIRVTAAYDE